MKEFWETKEFNKNFEKVSKGSLPREYVEIHTKSDTLYFKERKRRRPLTGSGCGP